MTPAGVAPTLRPRRIGLTGGIGSGKSEVARILVDLGATLVDTDAIARELTAPGGAALPALVDALGADILDGQGAMNRVLMRERAFKDESVRDRLQRVLHPLIRSEAARRAGVADPSQPVIFDVPLLVESGGWLEQLDRILVVDCTEATQIERVMRRSGWRREAVEAVLVRQASRAQRLAVADDVIFNEGLTLDTLRDRVHALWRDWGRLPHST